jgi:hypothetical protein
MLAEPRPPSNGNGRSHSSSPRPSRQLATPAA